MYKFPIFQHWIPFLLCVLLCGQTISGYHTYICIVKQIRTECTSALIIKTPAGFVPSREGAHCPACGALSEISASWAIQWSHDLREVGMTKAYIARCPDHRHVMWSPERWCTSSYLKAELFLNMECKVLFYVSQLLYIIMVTHRGENNLKANQPCEIFSHFTCTHHIIDHWITADSVKCGKTAANQ